MNTFIKEAQDLLPQLKEIRRTIHAHPETGNEEFQTSQLVLEVLHKSGIPARRILETGVQAEIRGEQEGPCILLRSDLDALPVQEETGLPFASKIPGKMHACGHDMHIASLLGGAFLLKKHRKDLHGTVRLVFEPDEEGDGGAERLIDAGILNGVDAVFGLHCSPDLPAGSIGIRYGSFYAAAAKFDVTVHGKGCHGAEPEKGTDALYAAARMVTALHQLTSGSENERLVVSTGMFQAGTARNIIPDSAFFSGIIRTFGIEHRTSAMNKVKDVIADIAQRTETRAEVSMETGYPGVVNHDRETAFVQHTAEELLGASMVHLLKEPTMATEDFGYYLLKKPGCFYHLGVNSPFGLHSPRFNPDEAALASGAAMHAAIGLQYGKEQL